MKLAECLMLSAAAFAAAGISRGLAQGFMDFDSVPASAGCSARTVSAAARSDIECAVLSAQSAASGSFSFINGVCILSESPDCTAPGAGSVFRKRWQHPGYEQQIGGRRFWVFQQRLAGRVSFNRTWVEYEDGFGEGIDGVATEFWSGLLLINAFTKSHSNTLRMEATTVDRAFYAAEWLNFTVGSAGTNYTMNCGAYVSGSSNFSGDALDWSRNQKFSTIDRDTDADTTRGCSNIFGGGGFWYGGCFHINPNGLYNSSTQQPASKWSYMSSDYIEALKVLSFFRMMLQF